MPVCCLSAAWLLVITACMCACSAYQRTLGSLRLSSPVRGCVGERQGVGDYQAAAQRCVFDAAPEQPLGYVVWCVTGPGVRVVSEKGLRGLGCVCASDLCLCLFLHLCALCFAFFCL